MTQLEEIKKNYPLLWERVLYYYSKQGFTSVNGVIADHHDVNCFGWLNTTEGDRFWSRLCDYNCYSEFYENLNK